MTSEEVRKRIEEIKKIFGGSNDVVLKIVFKQKYEESIEGIFKGFGAPTVSVEDDYVVIDSAVGKRRPKFSAIEKIEFVSSHELLIRCHEIKNLIESIGRVLASAKL